MVASPKVTHQHTIYAVSEHPRELTSTDLGFICQYTGESSDTVLPHVLEVWRDTKKQVELFPICGPHTGYGMTHSICHIEYRSSGCLQFWVFKCIQEFMFLTPKIAAHRHYQVVQAAQHSKHNTKLLHMVQLSEKTDPSYQSLTCCCAPSPHRELLQDIGCCFGQDTRQLIVDGWKDSELIALDLSPDYWCVKSVCVMSC